MIPLPQPQMPPQAAQNMGLPQGQQQPQQGQGSQPSEQNLPMPDPRDPTGGQEPIVQEVMDEGEEAIEELCSNISKVFGRYKNVRGQVIEESWYRCIQDYKGEFNIMRWPYSSHYELRECFHQIEIQNAQMYKTYFGNRTNFEFQALHMGGEESAAAATKVVEYQIRHHRINKQLRLLMAQPGLFSVGYGLYGWRKYEPIRFKRTQAHQAWDGTEINERDTEEWMYGGPSFENVTPWKIFCDPQVEDIENSPFTFMRELVSGEYLKTMVNEGRFAKKRVEESLENNSGGFRDDYLQMMNHQELHTHYQHAEMIGDDAEHELLWVWTNTGWVYAFVDLDTGDRQCVMAQRNPFGRVPIITLKNHPQADQHYAIADAELLRAETMFLRDSASLTMDSVHQNLQPMWQADESLRNTVDNMLFQPGAVFFTEGGKGLTPLQTNTQAVPALMQFTEWIRKNMARTTGINDEAQGSPNDSNTATKFRGMQSAGMAILNYKISTMQPEIEEFYMKMYQLNAAFLDAEIPVRLDGVRGGTVFERYDNKVFQPDVDVKVNLPPTMEDVQQRRAQLMQFMQVTAQVPNVNKEYILEELARAFEFNNPKRIVINAADGQGDALEENMDMQKVGWMPDAAQPDNHQQHMQVHSMFMQTPDFQQLEPDRQQKFQRHVQMHQAMLQQQQEAQQQQEKQQQMQLQMHTPSPPRGSPRNAPPQGRPQPGSTKHLANSATERQFGNGQRGAQQQGRMQRRVSA